MKTDSYPRFLKSTLYKECVVSDLDTHSVTTANKQQPTVKSTSQLNTTVSDSGGKMDRKVCETQRLYPKFNIYLKVKLCLFTRHVALLTELFTV